MEMAYDGVLSKGTFYNGFHEIVDLHIKLMRASVYSLNDIQWCSFVDYITNKTIFYVTMDRIAREITNDNISKEKKRKVGFYQTDGATLLLEPTGRSA